MLCGYNLHWKIMAENYIYNSNVNDYLIMKTGAFKVKDIN